MAKRKNFWYVIVMTNNGPVFVTKVDYSNKTAEWNRDERPLELGETWAKDLAFGLSANFYSAFAVHSSYERDTQPYRYELGHFEWQWNEKEE